MIVETQKDQWDQVAGEIAFSLEPDLDRLAILTTKNARILDYGCGYGRVTHELHDKGYNNIVGLDTSSEMIKRGLKQYPQLDLRYITDYGIPDEPGHFDVILLCAVLTCIPNQAHRATMLEVVYQSLKGGGIIYCAEFHKSETINYSPAGTFTSKFGVEMKHFLPEEMTEELKWFKTIHLSVSEASTLSGSKTHAIHYFGQKV